MWKTLGAIRGCEAPKCDIRTNKRYHKAFRRVVACCPKHAQTALDLVARRHAAVLAKAA